MNSMGCIGSMESTAILAIDAATEACSVALQYQGQVISRFEVCPQQHSQLILPMVDEVLKEAGVTLPELDLLAFGCGPGSFTGVRIGVGVAQGLAFGADLPLVGVSTLQTMAQGAIRLNSADSVIAAIDARMGEIYTAEFINENGLACRVEADIVIKPELVEYTLSEKVFAVGTGWQTYQSELSAKVPGIVATEILYPHAIDMLPLAQALLADNKQIAAEDAQPVYVRDTVTWKKLPGRDSLKG
jgi:tRNA threonylcarbamoyladenosine biosynthesis protein TsaB